jgi:hypothetical protein
LSAPHKRLHGAPHSSLAFAVVTAFAVVRPASPSSSKWPRRQLDRELRQYLLERRDDHRHVEVCRRLWVVYRRATSTEL